jgi:type II secretory pathway pseudopilin PulG
MELIVVLVLLAVLGSIAFSSIGSATTGSAVAACNANVRTVDSALQAFMIENPGPLPTTSAAWELALLGQTQSGEWTTIEQGAPFLSSWPSSSDYRIIVAGQSAPATTGGLPVTPGNGSVLVTSTASSGRVQVVDATVSPSTACAGA